MMIRGARFVSDVEDMVYAEDAQGRSKGVLLFAKISMTLYACAALVAPGSARGGL